MDDAACVDTATNSEPTAVAHPIGEVGTPVVNTVVSDEIANWPQPKIFANTAADMFVAP